MKVELFGISKDKRNDIINIFFKGKKKYIYNLMFMREEEYEQKAESKFKGSAFSLKMKFIKREKRKYQIRLYKLLQNDYNANDFEMFHSQWAASLSSMREYFKTVELYEFIFSELYSKIKNEENISILALSGTAKNLYKILQTGEF